MQAMACMLPTLRPGMRLAAAAAQGSAAGATGPDAAVIDAATAALMTHVDAMKARAMPSQTAVEFSDIASTAAAQCCTFWARCRSCLIGG